MKLSKLASFVSLLGLMVASTVDTQAANPADRNSGTILFNLTGVEQVKNYVEGPADVYVSTTRNFAIGNAQVIQFIGDLMEETFSAKSIFVLTNDYIYIKDGTNALVDVTDFFYGDALTSVDLFYGVYVDKAAYEQYSLNYLWFSQFIIADPCYFTTSESAESHTTPRIEFYGTTAYAYSSLDTYAKNFFTESWTQVTTGGGFGYDTDGNEFIVRGSVAQTKSNRYTYVD